MLWHLYVAMGGKVFSIQLVGVGVTRGVGTGALRKLGDSTEYRRWVLETGRLSVYVIIV